jgi:hypothetical protein
MVKTAIALNSFYVYALFREDLSTPFYIGKGYGNRIFAHEKEAARKSSHKNRIIRKMWGMGFREIPKIKLIENITDDVAKQIEIDLIHLIGRYPNGPLTNISRGGDGVNFGISPSVKTRELTRRAMLAIWADPEQRAMRAAASAKAQNDPDYRAKRSKIAKQMWTAEEFRQKAIESKRAFWRTKIISTEERDTMSRRLNNPQAVLKRIMTNKIPEVRNNRVAAQKKAFATPAAKAIRSAASKKLWATKRKHIISKRARARQNAAPPTTPAPQQSS